MAALIAMSNVEPGTALTGLLFAWAGNNMLNSFSVAAGANRVAHGKPLRSHRGHRVFHIIIAADSESWIASWLD